MDCRPRHTAGFTCRLSKLKPRTSEKMGGLIMNNEDLFFSSPILLVENRTSEDVSIFFCSFSQCNKIA